MATSNMAFILNVTCFAFNVVHITFCEGHARKSHISSLGSHAPFGPVWTLDHSLPIGSMFRSSTPYTTPTPGSTCAALASDGSASLYLARCASRSHSDAVPRSPYSTERESKRETETERNIRILAENLGKMEKTGALLNLTLGSWQ